MFIFHFDSLIDDFDFGNLLMFIHTMCVSLTTYAALLPVILSTIIAMAPSPVTFAAVPKLS